MHILDPSFGFFKDMASIYLFVRGQTSFFTCIPRETRTVQIKKDGVQLQLPRMEDNYVNKQPIYRTDYTVYFDSPGEQDSGTYTCQYGTNTLDYTVKVIGLYRPTVFFVQSTPKTSIYLII